MTIFRTLTTSVVIAAIPAFVFAQDTTAPNTDIPAVVLEQTTQQFIDSLKGSTPINQLPYEKARQVLIDVQTKDDTAMPEADVQEMTLNVGPTDEVKGFTVRPAGTKGESLPGVVYFHAGGWVLGNFTTHERLMRWRKVAFMSPAEDFLSPREQNRRNVRVAGCACMATTGSMIFSP